MYVLFKKLLILLAITWAHMILLTAIPKQRAVIIPAHCLIFFSNDICRSHCIRLPSCLIKLAGFSSSTFFWFLDFSNSYIFLDYVGLSYCFWNDRNMKFWACDVRTTFPGLLIARLGYLYKCSCASSITCFCGDWILFSRFLCGI